MKIGVDTAAFDAAMQRQRAEARKAWSGSGEAATETVWFAVKDRAGATDFLGYDTEKAEGVIAALVRDGAQVEKLSAGEKGGVILNQTPFLRRIGRPGRRHRRTACPRRADAGGKHRQESRRPVRARGRRRGRRSRPLAPALQLEVDHERRMAIRANHSATHLLHEALREVLGDHVAQKGSLVAPDRLRFDFAHPKPVTDQELAQIEDIANQVVLENAPVVTRLMAVDQAIESGARALFGEKYGDEVRVVSMGSGPAPRLFGRICVWCRCGAHR